MDDERRNPSRCVKDLLAAVIPGPESCSDAMGVSMTPRKPKMGSSMTKMIGASKFARMLDQKRHENLETDTDLTTKQGIWREPSLVDRGKPMVKKPQIFLEF